MVTLPKCPKIVCAASQAAANQNEYAQTQMRRIWVVLLAEPRRQFKGVVGAGSRPTRMAWQTYSCSSPFWFHGIFHATVQGFV